MISEAHPRRGHFFILLIMAVFAHGLLLVNDGLYEDDWLIYTKLLQQNSAAIRAEWIETTGLPEGAYFHLLLGQVMGHAPTMVTAYKFVSFTAIVVIAIAAYLIACRSGMVSSQEALLIGLLTLIYPGNQTTVQPITTPYFLFYAIFMTAAYLALRFEYAGFAYPRRILPLALFAFSFALNSLLVFFYGFLLLLFLYRQNLKTLPLRESITTFAVAHLDYLFLPPLYWILKKSWFPTGQYNEFRLSAMSLIGSVYVFFRDALFGQVVFGVRQMMQHWMLSVIVLIAGFAVFRLFQRRSAPQTEERRSVVVLVAFAVVLLGCAIFPYVVVGKSPGVHGYATRHGLLLSVPIGILAAAVFRWFRNQHYQLVGVIVLSAVLTGCVFANIANYISWQVRSVKDHSIIRNLQQMQKGREISIFWVDDQFNAGPVPAYKYYEWSSIFFLAWGGESHIGLDTYSYDPGFLVDMSKEFHTVNNLSTLNPDGLQGDLTVTRSDDGAISDVDLVLTYTYNRFFDRPALDKLLASLTTLQITPYGH